MSSVLFESPYSRSTVRRDSVHIYEPKSTGVSMESDIYNDTALQQYEVVEQLLPFFERALEGVDKYVGGDPNAPLVLADFGVSGGKACVPVVKKVQELFDMKTTLYLNDRKENDWDVTLRTIDEGLGDSVTAHCLPKDMFTKMDIPAGSLHCAWSTTALQWLSIIPSAFTTGTNAMQRMRSDPSRVKWTMQAKKDLHNFCVNRAAEMAPGGVLVFSFPCLNSEDSPDQMRFADVVFSDAKNLLVLEGVLTEDDEKTLVIPEYYRSEREVLEVLNSPEMEELWKVKDVDSIMMEDPWVDAWRRGDITREQCAEMQTKATRSYNDGIVRSKIKSKEKRDKLWNVLGERHHKKTQKHKIDKSKNLSESLCEKSPELASHRMKYICVALQRNHDGEGRSLA